MVVPESVKFHESIQAQFALLSERVQGWIEGKPIPDDQELLLEALHLTRKIDPLQLLSFATLQAFAGQRSDSSYLGDRPVQQCHLELIQGLMLTLPIGSYSRSAVMTDKHSWEIFELIRDSLLAFSINFHKDEYTGRDAKDAANSIVNDARQETLFVRNQAFGHQVKALIRRIFAPVDVSMKEACEFTADELMDFVLAIWKSVNDRASKYYTKLEIIRHKTSRTEICQEFAHQFGLSDSEKRKFREQFDPNLDEQGLFNALHTATSNRCTRIFTFSFAELKKLFPSNISDPALKRLLDKLSLKFGDLRNFDTNFFFLGNPVWVQPVIQLSETDYYFAGLGAFFSFPLEILLSVLKEHAQIVDHFHQGKGKILESWVLEGVAKYFPAQEIYRNVLRTQPVHGEDGENDIVVLTDRLLFLIEAKSGEAEPGALRGGYPSLKASLEHLAVEPGDQSGRFIEFLTTHPGRQQFTTGDTARDLVIDFAQVRRVIRLSITLDGLGILAAKVHRLKTAGLATNTWDPAPCMSLFDFLMCTELLDSAPVLLHYFASREAIERMNCWRSDEQDFLGLYIREGYSSLSASPGGEHELYGESKHVFDYFYNQFKGTPSAKPTIALPETWAKLCEVANATRSPNWTESMLLLLSVPSKLQKDAELCIKQLTAIALDSNATISASFQFPKSTIPDLQPFVLSYAACPNAQAITTALQQGQDQGANHRPTLIAVNDCSSNGLPALDTSSS